jgi:hypothetical protein
MHFTIIDGLSAGLPNVGTILPITNATIESRSTPLKERKIKFMDSVSVIEVHS